MTEERFSLPPLLPDDVKGNLVMIFLKPALIPSLNSNQYLEFRYCWWGSDVIHKTRLTPDLDELRVVFDIRCDIKGFRNYLSDAACLNVDIFVVSNEKTNCDKYSPVKYQVRRKRTWKTGDYVGKFVLNNLTLNNRGEYVKECNIINGYNDQLGTVVVFMLFTSQTLNFPLTKKAINENENQKQLNSKNEIQKQLDGKNENQKQLDGKKEYQKQLNGKIQRTKSYGQNDVTPKNKIKPLREHLSSNNATLINDRNKLRKNLFSINITPTKESKEARENLSPRFVVFDNSPSKKSSKSILKRKCLISPSKIEESPSTSYLQCELGQVRNIDATVAKPEILSRFSEDKNLITRLFSFVDSGAIDPTDLPTLIQICQGRSPSLDLDYLDLHDRSLMNSCSSFASNREENLSSVKVHHPKDIENPLNKNLNPKRKVCFTNSAPTYCSRLQKKSPKVNHYSSSQRISPKVNREFDEKCVHSLSLKDQDEMLPKKTSSPVKSFPVVKCKISTPEKRERIENESEDLPEIRHAESSLLVLRLQSVHFNYNINSPKKNVAVKGTQSKSLL